MPSATVVLQQAKAQASFYCMYSVANQLDMAYALLSFAKWLALRHADFAKCAQNASEMMRFRKCKLAGHVSHASILSLPANCKILWWCKIVNIS
jgi:hypothetical protein